MCVYRESIDTQPALVQHTSKYSSIFSKAFSDMAPRRSPRLAALARFPANLPADMKCSICLENVVDNNLKGISKLQCGHFFHLACIGPEFNIKGAMVCPNCREVEDSEWMFSLGSFANGQPSPDIEAMSSDDDEGIPDPDVTHQEDIPHATYQQNLHAPHGSLSEGQTMHPQRMFGPFPYSGAPEMPLFDYGGEDSNSPMPFLHFRQHTYVAPTIGFETNLPAINIFNSVGYSRHFRNVTGFGPGGSPGAGTSAGGDMPSPQGNPYVNFQPQLDVPSSSTHPTMARGAPLCTCHRELDFMYAPEGIAYHGNSSSAADPPEGLLDIGIGVGSRYRGNSSKDGNQSPQRIPLPVYGSAAFPIDLDDAPDGGSPN